MSENLAFRWFCFLNIDDKVFDHSTISYFIECIGDEGFGEIFHRFNEKLHELELLSPPLTCMSTPAYRGRTSADAACRRVV